MQIGVDQFFPDPAQINSHTKNGKMESQRIDDPIFNGGPPHCRPFLFRIDFSGFRFQRCLIVEIMGPAFPYGNIDQDHATEDAPDQSNCSRSNGKRGTVRPSQFFKHLGHAPSRTMTAQPAFFHNDTEQRIHMEQRNQDQGTEKHGDSILGQRNHPSEGNGTGYFFHSSLTAADTVEHQHGSKHKSDEPSGKSGPGRRDFLGNDTLEKRPQCQPDQPGHQRGRYMIFAQKAHFQADHGAHNQQNAQQRNTEHQGIQCSPVQRRNLRNHTYPSPFEPFRPHFASILRCLFPRLPVFSLLR